MRMCYMYRIKVVNVDPASFLIISAQSNFLYSIVIVSIEFVHVRMYGCNFSAQIKLIFFSR